MDHPNSDDDGNDGVFLEDDTMRNNQETSFVRKVSKGDISSESGDSSSENEIIQNDDSEQKPRSRVQGRTIESVMRVKAWAIMRGHSGDHLITSKEIVLGRDEERKGESSQYIQVSESKKVSRKAARIVYDEEKEDFIITNLSKNAILVDRKPLLKSEDRILSHKSLLLIGDDGLFFFLLPQEHLERKKRFLKERRKTLLEEAHVLNPPKNNYDINQAKRAKYGLVLQDEFADNSGSLYNRKLKNGIGKRLNLKEMLMLHRLTKQQTMSHLGLSHLPPGTKAPPALPNTLNNVLKK